MPQQKDTEDSACTNTATQSHQRKATSEQPHRKQKEDLTTQCKTTPFDRSTTVTFSYTTTTTHGVPTTTPKMETFSSRKENPIVSTMTKEDTTTATLTTTHRSVGHRAISQQEKINTKKNLVVSKTTTQEEKTRQIFKNTLFFNMRGSAQFVDVSPFKGGPKVWANFYEAFVSHTLKKQRMLNLNSLYHCSVLAIEWYWFRSKERRFKINSNHHYPTGEQQIQFFGKRDPPAWKMTLNKKLAMKIMFYFVSIKFGQIGMCFEGLSFVIKDISRYRSETFVYCGVLAHFTLFPASHKLQLSFPCSRLNDGGWSNRNICWNGWHKISLMYSVIDKGMIHNQPVSDSNKVQRRITETFVLKGTELVVSYLLMVKKHSFIHMNLSSFASSFYNIFDGPTIASRKLNLSAQHTSTFQALAVVWKNQTLIENLLLAIDYKSIKHFASGSISLKVNTTIRRTFCLDTSEFFPLVWNVNAPQKQQVKVITHKINFSGPMSYQCNYGGVAFLEVNGVEILSLCSSHDHANLSRHAYSRTSEMVLVVYRYNLLGEISVSAETQTTKCKSILVDLCKTVQHCPKRFTGSPFQTTDIIFMRLFCHRYENLLQYTPQNGAGCFVLQVYSKEIIQNSTVRCFFSIEDKHINRLSVPAVNFHIRLSVPSVGHVRPDKDNKWLHDNLVTKRPSNFSTRKLHLTNSGFFEPGTNLDLKTQIVVPSIEPCIKLSVDLRRQYYSPFWLDIGVTFPMSCAVPKALTATYLIGNRIIFGNNYFYKPFAGVKQFYLLVRSPTGVFPNNVQFCTQFWFNVGEFWHIYETSIAFDQPHEVALPTSDTIVFVKPGPNSDTPLCDKVQCAELNMRIVLEEEQSSPTSLTICSLQQCISNFSKIQLYNQTHFDSYSVIIQKKDLKVSWLKAAEICGNVGGALPAFFSNDDWIKIQQPMKIYFTKYYHQPAIFIGLAVNKAKKVVFSFQILCAFLEQCRIFCKWVSKEI